MRKPGHPHVTLKNIQPLCLSIKLLIPCGQLFSVFNTEVYTTEYKYYYRSKKICLSKNQHFSFETGS